MEGPVPQDPAPTSGLPANPLLPAPAPTARLRGQARGSATVHAALLQADVHHLHGFPELRLQHAQQGRLREVSACPRPCTPAPGPAPLPQAGPCTPAPGSPLRPCSSPAPCTPAPPPPPAQPLCLFCPRAFFSTFLPFSGKPFLTWGLYRTLAATL